MINNFSVYSIVQFYFCLFALFDCQQKAIKQKYNKIMMRQNSFGFNISKNLSPNRLAIFNKSSHMKRMVFLQPERTSGQDDSQFDFQFELRSRQLMSKVRPQYSLNLLKSKTSMSPRKQLQIPSKQLNAMNILNSKVLQHQSLKSTIRIRKKLTTIPFRSNRSPKAKQFIIRDKIRQGNNQIHWYQYNMKLHTKQGLLNTKNAIDRPQMQKNRSKQIISIEQMVQSDYILLKQQKIDFQIYILKLRKQQLNRRHDNISKWSTFSYDNVAGYLEQ